MDAELILDGKKYAVSISNSKIGQKVRINDKESAFESTELSGNCFRVSCGRRSRIIHVSADGGKSYVHVDGIVLTLEKAGDESSATGHGHDELVDGKQIVHAPMPGKIVKISVSKGQKVQEKQILCVVEAMKMENEVRAKLNGIVLGIGFKAGDLVGTDDVILTVGPSE